MCTGVGVGVSTHSSQDISIAHKRPLNSVGAGSAPKKPLWYSTGRSIVLYHCYTILLYFFP